MGLIDTLLAWVLLKLDAPWWCWALLVSHVVVLLVRVGYSVGKGK